MSLFKQKGKIGNYIVSFLIKEGEYAESYRVKDMNGKNYFLKLFHYAKLHRNQYDTNGNILEIEISKFLSHTNVLSYHDCGELALMGQRFAYVVYDFIAGETVAQKTAREHRCSVYEAKVIITGVLDGLKFLHSLEDPIIHNELTLQNVMLDMSDGNSKPIIIDFGHARFLSQDYKSFYKEGLNPFFMAPETFNGVYSVQSDLYSVGAMLYTLLFGQPPHFIDLSEYQQSRDSLEDTLAAERQNPIRILNTNLYELDEQLIRIIEKSLANDIQQRFSSADEFIKTLKGEIEILPLERASDKDSHQQTKNIKKGNGFADIVGMTELKERLQFDVIDLIKNPEEAKSWGIKIPNGLLFYGPPGCGKTYFAEKFAEEAGCNFIQAHCSDIASPYIHGGQNKISELFKEARKNAPTILFLDEIDAMLTDRSKQSNVSESGEVNEFLTQLNNCGQDGVIVIGATNNPSQIDRAALRSGRLELKYYIAQPDKEARQGLFELYLKHTKVDFGIDYTKLASQTGNYIAAEIKLIVEEAVRLSRRRKLRYVTMDVLEEIINEHKPDLTEQDIAKYEKIKEEFDGTKKKEDHHRIGFY